MSAGGVGPGAATAPGTGPVAGAGPSDGSAAGPGGQEPAAGRLPVVAIAGRPNVGKSTLVNRIVGRRVAVVEERPGVTRDRLELTAQWNGCPFTVVDTGGWVAGGDELDAKVSAQSERAVVAADLVLLVVDVTVGVTEDDLAAARRLRRLARRVLVVANKVDNERRELEAWELVRLGLGDPVPVSALHGRGTGDLLDLVVGLLGEPGAGPEAPGGSGQGAEQAGAVAGGAGAPAGAHGTEVGLDPSEAGPGEGAAGLDGTAVGPDGAGAGPGEGAAGPHDGDGTAGAAEGAGTWAGCPAVALVGRPNVGKSTLFNRLIGDERSVVHDMPGTTRDAIDTVVVTTDGPVRFVDTAGIRRRSKGEEGTEFYAMVRALQAVDRSDIAILVVDATVGVTHQDQRLAERIGASGSPVVVVLNKWELVATEDRPEVVDGVEDRLAFLGDVPVIKISARTGLGVHKLLPALRRAVDAYRSRIPTGELNRALRAIQQAHPAPGARIRYGVQATSEPPTFTLFCNRRLPPTYLRYVERKLREQFRLGPTPVTFRVRVEGRR